MWLPTPLKQDWSETVMCWPWKAVPYVMTRRRTWRVSSCLFLGLHMDKELNIVPCPSVPIRLVNVKIFHRINDRLRPADGALDALYDLSSGHYDEIWTKCDGNQSNNCWDISEWTKVLDWHTDFSTPRVCSYFEIKANWVVLSWNHDLLVCGCWRILMDVSVHRQPAVKTKPASASFLCCTSDHESVW